MICVTAGVPKHRMGGSIESTHTSDTFCPFSAEKENENSVEDASGIKSAFLSLLTALNQVFVVLSCDSRGIGLLV